MLLAKKCLVFYLVSTETSSSLYVRNAKVPSDGGEFFWVCAPQLVTGTDKYYSFFFLPNLELTFWPGPKHESHAQSSTLDFSAFRFDFESCKYPVEMKYGWEVTVQRKAFNGYFIL